MKKCVMVCDDDEGILDSISIVLDLHGYKVIPVLHSLEIFAKIKEEKPDIVLLDLWMPILNGEQVLQKLKASDETKDIPVIVVTASKDGKAIADKYGASAYLPKPFDLIKLDALIAKNT
ncbi:MAG: response regulator [Patescibacteria group bacterium]